MINLSAELKELNETLNNIRKYFESDYAHQTRTEISKALNQIKYIRSIPLRVEPGFAYGIEPQPTVRVNTKVGVEDLA